MDCPWTKFVNLGVIPTNHITLGIHWIVHGQSMESMDFMDGLWIPWLSVKYSNHQGIGAAKIFLDNICNYAHVCKLLLSKIYYFMTLPIGYML